MWLRVVFWPLFAFIMGFALGGSVIWAQQSEPVHRPSTNEAQQVGPSSVRHQSPVPRHGDGAHTEGYLNIFGEHTPDWFVAIFTLALCVVTGCLVRSTNILWKTAERDTRILQRAYIAVDLDGINPFRRVGGADGTHVAIGHVMITNAGNLPATGIRCCVKIGFGENDGRADFPISEADFFGDFILPPKGMMRHGTDYFNVPAQGWLYVWGEVRYRDGFNENPTRVTRFCHRYARAMLEKMDGGHGIKSQHGRFHTSGNSTDESAFRHEA